MIQADLQGIPAMQQKVARILAATPPAAGQGLYRAGNDIMGVSVTLVPVDTGLLRSTAHVDQPQQQGQTVVVQLSYGGRGLAPYAVRVEMDDTMNHPNGGQAHFLQQPLFASVATLTQQLAGALRPALRS